MKAAFYDGNGKMMIQKHPDPIPDEGDAIIQVRATGICGSDLLMNNDKEEADELPAGHEVTGIISDVGVGVDREKSSNRNDRPRSRLFNVLVLSNGPVSTM